MAASIIIVSVSDKHTVESWKIQPSVLLNFLSSLSSVALGTAFSQGVAITWWTSARDGATLSQLHYIWDTGAGISFRSALSAGGNAKKVAFTGLVIAMINISTGTLLQRATHQVIQDVVTPETIQLNISQVIPEGWSGNITDATIGLLNSSTAALLTAQGWWRNSTINTVDAPGYYCDGTCEGIVPGAGMSYNCSSTTQSLNLYTGAGTIIFAINTTIGQDSTGAPFLLLTTLYSSAVDDTCTATLTVDSCQIEAGVVQYPVVIQNSTVALNTAKLSNITLLSRYSYPGDLPSATPGTPSGTLQTLNDYYGTYFGTFTKVYSPFQYTGASMLADMFYNADPSSYDNFTYPACYLSWSSPTSYVLGTFQDFLFRAALRSASSGADVQAFQVQRTTPTLVFHSEYGYLAAASFISLLGPFFTFFRLQGWSSLGRTVSLSPLETARAFLATLIITRTGRCLTADEILQFAGPTVVRYVDGEMIVVEQSRDTEEGQTQIVPNNVEVQARNDDRVSIICYCRHNVLTTTFRVKTLAVKMKFMNYHRFRRSMPPVWQATSGPNLISIFLSACHSARALTCFA